MNLPLAPKQLEFIINSNAHWNLAHGSVRSGKTVGTLFRFMQSLDQCPDSQIWMVGHTSDTIYQNAIRLLLESDQLSIFRPFCTWYAGKRQLMFRDKTISTLGAKDEGAIGQFQGKTMSRVYCDEMTLYPESIIDMIDTRLSNPHSMGFASMNPSHPNHKLKKWIDLAEQGNSNYYALHFNLDDNPYLDEEYKRRIRDSLSGLFYRRNYLGVWCLAEGAVFDFFDKKIHMVKSPPRAAEYWVAGIDYGTVNNFACTLVGISTGKHNQTGICRWAEKEYVWDSKKMGRQKTNAEYADDVANFLEPYAIKGVYIDPSAAAFKLELRKRGITVIDADNDVYNGINFMTSEMQKGNLFVCQNCSNLVREVESYVWDPRASEKGEDAPLKKDDHCFTSETLIATERGIVPIVEISVGDMVLTSKGFRKVIQFHQHEDCYNEYELFGIPIKCTHEHKFLTLNEGMKSISSLTQYDILFILTSLWKNTSASYLKAKDTDAIQILNDGVIKCISSVEVDTTIGSCTDLIVEKFPKDVIFITKTGTPLTMIYPIWNVLQPGNITTFIKKIFTQTISLCMPGKKRLNGIKVQPARNGTKNMLKQTDLEKTDRELRNVKYVKRIIKQLNRELPDFVQINASLNGEENLELTMSKETVLSVLKLLFVPGFLKPDFVPAAVVKKIHGKTNLYDLGIENVHEYFANGVLVSNCIDSLRYAVYSHKIPVYQPYKTDSTDYMASRFNPLGRRF